MILNPKYSPLTRKLGLKLGDRLLCVEALTERQTCYNVGSMATVNIVSSFTGQCFLKVDDKPTPDYNGQQGLWVKVEETKISLEDMM